MFAVMRIKAAGEHVFPDGYRIVFSDTYVEAVFETKEEAEASVRGFNRSPIARCGRHDYVMIEEVRYAPSDLMLEQEEEKGLIRIYRSEDY